MRIKKYEARSVKGKHLFLALFLFTSLVWGCGKAERHNDNRTDTTITPSDSAPASERSSSDSTTVTLFMVESAGDSARKDTFGCGDLLVEKAHTVAKGGNLLAATMRALIAPQNDGPGNFVAGDQIRLDSATLEGRIARVYLSGVIPLAGVCDHPRVSEQLRRTALQFPDVDSALIYIGSETLDQYLSLQ